MCVTQRQIADGVADEFLNDVKKCTAEIMKNPKDKAEGSVSHIPLLLWFVAVVSFVRCSFLKK